MPLEPYLPYLSCIWSCRIRSLLSHYQRIRSDPERDLLTPKLYRIADQVKDVWGFDEEGELRTMWRRSGHSGLWFFGGNLYVFSKSETPILYQFLSLETCLGSFYS